jgi:hypothetical protein
VFLPTSYIAEIQNNQVVKSHTPDHSFFIHFITLKMQLFYFKVLRGTNGEQVNMQDNHNAKLMK